MIFGLLMIMASMTFAQSVPLDSAVCRRLDFINYLIGREDYKDAVFLLDKEINSNIIPGSMLSDSINHLLGWSYYAQKELENSRKYFERVSKNSSSFLKCRLFATYNSIYMEDTGHAMELLTGLKTEIDWQKELVDFEKAGINLLKRDFPAYHLNAATFSHTFYPLVQEEQRFDHVAVLLEQYRPKSMALAAMMSAIIPGSGKIYAGKTGEGVSSFLIVTVLSLITWENYRNDGLSDYKTILAGSALSLYYFGNI